MIQLVLNCRFDRDDFTELLSGSAFESRLVASSKTARLTACALLRKPRRSTKFRPWFICGEEVRDVVSTLRNFSRAVYRSPSASRGRRAFFGSGSITHIPFARNAGSIRLLWSMPIPSHDVLLQDPFDFGDGCRICY